jgi:hypothetical protein
MARANAWPFGPASAPAAHARQHGFGKLPRRPTNPTIAASPRGVLQDAEHEGPLAAHPPGGAAHHFRRRADQGLKGKR